MPQFDCLVVGAGLFGSTFARCVADRGLKPLVIDRRAHIAGNTFDERLEGINVHRYGPHIFHTNDERVWRFVNRFCRFIQYEHRVKGVNQGRVFPVPVNLMTMYILWGVTTPAEAKRKLDQSRIACQSPQNLEDWVLHNIGRDLYELVVKGYTEKQWGRPCAELPARIIRRLPVRLNWDDRYHNSRYSGLPEEGYTSLSQNMLDGIEVELGVDYLVDRSRWDQVAKSVVYSGPLDAFFDYCHGDLQYRSLRFETQHLQGDVQGCPQLNYTSADVPYTRVLEWKHFERLESPHTVLTHEYPQEWSRGAERFYPIGDERNLATYGKYKQQAAALGPRFIFGGRLGSYKYMDMDQTIAQALSCADRFLAARASAKLHVFGASPFRAEPAGSLIAATHPRPK